MACRGARVGAQNSEEFFAGDTPAATGELVQKAVVAPVSGAEHKIVGQPHRLPLWDLVFDALASAPLC